MKSGLIMEGGAMRGMFTAGVIDVFMENGVDFDGAVGVSAGATFGCNIKSRQIGRSIRYNTRFCKDYRYGSIKSFLLHGDLFEKEFCYNDIPNKLDLFDTETFKSNPMDFYVVATDMVTGKPVYHKMTDGGENDLEWIRASASIPLVSQIVKVDGYELLDGGISDSVPLRFMEKMGYDKKVVILTQPDSYRKKKNKFSPLCYVKYSKYPKFAKVFADRHIMYNGTVRYIKEQEKLGKCFVIKPEMPLNIKPAEKNPEEMKRVYQLGRIEAMKQLESLKAYLAE